MAEEKIAMHFLPLSVITKGKMYNRKSIQAIGTGSGAQKRNS
jgi:hypothetical protein